MSEQGVDLKRRRFLTASVAVVGGAGAVAAAIPFVTYMTPSDKARAAGAPVEVDISKLEPGQKIVELWRGKPVWILRRTPEMLANLEKIEPKLKDPKSLDPEQQPAYAQNETRSIKPEILVAVGLCTHLGCSPTFRPDLAPADLGEDWLGGFFCPCHGSLFDLAGRVYDGVPAQQNLQVPPHTYLSDTVILVGADEGAVS